MTTNKVQRYEWEDSLLKAERLGLLPAPAVNMALRLAHAINWVPKDKRPAGLYWDNESALKQVGSSRSTYFRVKGPLFEHGFFTQVRGNLIPQVPDLSQYETDESQVETPESQVETPESQCDTPFTVNTLSDNTFSDDSLSDNVRVGDAHSTADAALEPVKNKEDKERAILIDNTLNGYSFSDSLIDDSLILNVVEAPGPINVNEEAGGAAAAGAGKVTDKWKRSQGLNPITVEGPEWAQPGWTPPVKEEVRTDVCPECGEGDYESFCFPCGFVGEKA